MTLNNESQYKDRSLLIRLIGIPTLLIGLVAAVYAPLEFYPLYMFSEGGRFYYEGFSFGSFMFANIAVQVLGYYLVALIFIPLGYGHLRGRRWSRRYALSLLWFWLVVGAPLALLFVLMLFSVKDYPPALAWMILGFSGFSYPILPGLLISFYRREDVRLTFEMHDPRAGWWERTPLPTSVLILLFGFYVVFLHVPLLFRGAFPFFGRFLFDLDGILLIDLSVLILAALLFGVFKRQPWAWWGSLFYFSLLLINSVATLWCVPFPELLAGLQFPPIEMSILQAMPVQSYHLIAVIALPITLTLVVLIVARKSFTALSPDT